MAIAIAAMVDIPINSARRIVFGTNTPTRIVYPRLVNYSLIRSQCKPTGVLLFMTNLINISLLLPLIFE